MTQVWHCRGDRYNAGNLGIAGRSQLGLGNPVVKFGTDAQPARTLEPMIGEHKKPVSNTSKFKTAAGGRGGRHAVHVLKVRISTAQVAGKKTV